MSVDLKEIPDKDLKDELKRREEKKKQRERDRLKIHRALVDQYAETLLLFVPEHDRTSCSDEDPKNCSYHTGRIRCKRCELLYMLKKGHDNLNVSVYLDMQIEEEA